MSLTLKVDFDWGGAAALLASRNLEKGGLVQQAIDNAFIRWCEDYTPADTFMLAKSPYAA